MAILGVGTFAVSLADIALLLTIFSLGLGTPILILWVNCFIYGFCLLPAAIFGKRALPVSIALRLAVALLPSWLETRSLAPFVKDIVATDIPADIEGLGPPKNVVLVDINGNYRSDEPFGVGTPGACSSFCEALLRGGIV